MRFQVSRVRRDIINIAQEVKSKVVGKPFAFTILISVIKGSQSRFKWKDAFCRQKGVEDALDHKVESLHSLVVMIFGWLYG